MSIVARQNLPGFHTFFLVLFTMIKPSARTAVTFTDFVLLLFDLSYCMLSFDNGPFLSSGSVSLRVARQDLKRPRLSERRLGGA
ncbi:hypothetical protein IQ06DRAFT_125351 [Phaeosphaeriaceae sp. SRC1lsM3a]|nr:hypothetical protein IQ06DRAFT_125351 [Stagonospora sp. SRC1lsM3a]